MIPATSATLTLRTLLEAHPHTAALRDGSLRSELVDFAFDEAEVSNTRFKALVRDECFDLGELALVTFLQARSFHKPWVLIPAVTSSRGQHHTIFFNPQRGHLAPRDLNGLRVGVRAWTQTTGAWLRGILEEDYGVDFRKVQWVTFEDPHVAEYQDPPWVTRAREGSKLTQMLLDGELDAAILGRVKPQAGLQALIPDAQEEGRRWADRHGGVPINHMMVIREPLTHSRPDVVREVYRLLRQNADLAAATGNAREIRFGVEAVRQSLEVLIGYAAHQELIPRPFAVDELFNDLTRSLA